MNTQRFSHVPLRRFSRSAGFPEQRAKWVDPAHKDFSLTLTENKSAAPRPFSTEVSLNDTLPFTLSTPSTPEQRRVSFPLISFPSTVPHLSESAFPFLPDLMFKHCFLRFFPRAKKESSSGVHLGDPEMLDKDSFGKLINTPSPSNPLGLILFDPIMEPISTASTLNNLWLSSVAYSFPFPFSLPDVPPRTSSPCFLFENRP